MRCAAHYAMRCGRPRVRRRHTWRNDDAASKQALGATDRSEQRIVQPYISLNCIPNGMHDTRHAQDAAELSMGHTRSARYQSVVRSWKHAARGRRPRQAQARAAGDFSGRSMPHGATRRAVMQRVAPCCNHPTNGRRPLVAAGATVGPLSCGRGVCDARGRHLRRAPLYCVPSFLSHVARSP
jgi:hypothetical protein